MRALRGGRDPPHRVVDLDPTAHDATLRWLAYAHPALMLVALGCVLLALRRGLALRRLVRATRDERAARVAAHLAVAKPAVILVWIGLLGGLASGFWLRHWDPLHTLHGWLGLAAGLLFAAVGWIGRELEHGRSRALAWHARLALAAVLLAALAAMAGFVLLP